LLQSPDSIQVPVIVSSLAVTASIALQDVGGAIAKSLFNQISPDGMIALRLSMAALILLAIQRPWRTPVERKDWLALIVYGAMLGGIGLLLYRAFALIPIGVTVGIQATGPLAVALASSHRPRDLLWMCLAGMGLWLLLPGNTAMSALDPVGVGYAIAAAACWALYLIFAKRLSHLPNARAVPWGLLIGSAAVLPLGIATAGTKLLSPSALSMGLAAAILSSVIPNTLEMLGMRRLPYRTLGVLLSSAPAFAALAGFVVLDERLTPTQWTAIILVMLACIGCAASASFHRNVVHKLGTMDG
jgi:inner membrane transporter RhtA